MTEAYSPTIMRILLRRVRPLARIKLRVSRRSRMGGNPQNRMKRGHRIESAIEPKNKFVEVCLQMLWFYTPMMSTIQPSLQIAENKMDHRQVCLSLVGIATKRQEVMAVSHFWEPRIAGPSIGSHSSASGHVVFDKASKHFGAPIGDDAKPQPPRVNAAPMLLAILLARADFDGADDESLMMNAAPFAARLAANKAFVDLDGMLTADRISFRSDHAGAQLVENLKRRLIATKGKLALELDGRLSGNLRSHQVSAPKPSRER